MDGSVKSSEIQELKEFIKDTFNNFDKRLEKLEDAYKGDEYRPGFKQRIQDQDEELKRLDLSSDDVDMLKRMARGARSWKLIVGLTITTIGGLLTAAYKVVEILKHYSTWFGKG